MSHNFESPESILKQPLKRHSTEEADIDEDLLEEHPGSNVNLDFKY